MNQTKKVIITEETAKIRIDKALKNIYSDLSRALIVSWMNEGLVTVNGSYVKPSYETKVGDEIVIIEQAPVEIDLSPKDLKLDIIYEDSDVAVVYKPEGLSVHPANNSTDDTLVNGLLYSLNELSTIKGEIRPGIVHRIDKDTSGLLMVAKTDLAAEDLCSQLKAHTVVRKYQAVVYGVIGENMGRIDAPIGRDPNDRKKMAVVKDGKNAITNFKVLERLDKFTLIECQLETGRTHQIRVHMQYIGHPLVGDKAYGPRKVISDHGQFLHAKLIGFVHPRTKKYLEFDSELPEYMQEFIEEHKEK